ncbi:RNA polymerase sigma factor [Muricauda sp. SCSIO 64092]|uniref:RNA polymerase sigma factor n=1 Tax=Allomuricauda sp. SCSIO 64092 TaxID=2908842 RepID=UPI001FF629AC|nr:RNA polymerase sigma factor [Muricauda sp. SCSIO 64092]UOY07901.1 RNA polymerase sigma factor [Muricauda sp. SCSIO 64092]
MQQLTDNALMLKVKSGDLDKLGLLYERHKKRLFGFFYNLDHNSGLSEDLVQNVFVRMLKYRHTYSGDGSFLSWMFSMARNVRYDHYKKNGQKYTELSQVEYRMGDDETAEVKMERKDNVFIIQRAMMQLDSDKREVLVLSKFKEMKFSEIGKVLGCSEGAAKVKAHRALKDLKQIVHSMQIT